MRFQVFEELHPVHLGEELDPVHLGEVVIRYDYIVIPVFEDLKRLFGGRNGVNTDLPALLKKGAGDVDEVGTIMHKEYADHPVFSTTAQVR
jgi:hypothetical protein